MKKENEKKYPVPFHNDVFFKYMLIGSIRDISEKIFLPLKMSVLKITK